MRGLRPEDLTTSSATILRGYMEDNVLPFLSPQIINARHPFPHLENGGLYIVVRLDEEARPKAKKSKEERARDKAEAKATKNLGAEGVTLGIIPLPRQTSRVIELPGDGLQFILVERAIEMFAAEVFSMYTVKHTNIICVTRNADLDATEGADEQGEDYREHMKRILKKRSRLAPVRLESERPLSRTVKGLLLEKLGLAEHQLFVTRVPLNMGYTWGLGSRLSAEARAALTQAPFTPQWPACLDRKRSIIEQVSEHEVLLVLPLPVHGRLRAAFARGLGGSGRRFHQDHAVPPGEPVASGRGAHQRRRERQGGHGAVRAARPLRRVQQHRMVPALRGRRLPRHLRLPQLQGALEDLHHHAPNGKRPAAHHPAGHGQLQREDGEALHRLLVHHLRLADRPRRRRLLPQHGAGEHLRQLRHPVGRAAA